MFFVHQSAKDFLLNPKMVRDEVFPDGVEDVHQLIFAKSLEALQVTLKRDMYNLRAPGFPIEQVKAPDHDPLSTVRYSSFSDNRAQDLYLAWPLLSMMHADSSSTTEGRLRATRSKHMHQHLCSPPPPV
ncbi:hypothetical protein VTJ04DRAFT_5966 [Mycothermus thermophilus]|uniref:uncharacterized protein n=1 Tax=Humicola insolens TaxID=85995 RepID=UPI00374461EA